MATDDETPTESEAEALARSEATVPPFDAEAARANYLASCRDYVEKNGYQAVAYDQADGQAEGDPGFPVWQGSRVHQTDTDAITAAEKWCEAKVAQLGKIDELRRRRRRVLGPELGALLAKFDEIDSEHKALGRSKKAIQDKVRATVREAESPDVRLDFMEAIGSWTLEVIQGGKSTTIDTRQQTLELGEGDDDGDSEDPERSEGGDPEDRPGLDPTDVHWSETDAGDDSDPTEGG